MNKKLISLVLVLAMLCMSSMAFAASSVSTRNASGVLGATDDSGMLVEVLEPTEEINKLVANIIAFVGGGQGTVLDFLGEDVKTAIAQILGTNFDLSKLVLNEAVPFTVANANLATGDVTVTFQFNTKYEDGAVLVAIVGIIAEDGTIEWIVVPAKAVNGAVELTFTKELLEKLDGKTLVLGILSEDTSTK